ncbi:hypothetical protein KYY02_20130 [Streptomyces pimonensis]|uniref:Uncharacterized protein n=1 Tax=Streptomyces pimonensis TaxID=2860288 RepID=A0ABV4J272_9ACTN
MEHLGRRTWGVPEGFIPASSTGPEVEMTSHETTCILSTSDAEAHVQIALSFPDREPAGHCAATVPARRTLHQRFNGLAEEGQVPIGADYASVLVSDVPVVVQHTRLDSRRPANALLSTISCFAG